MGRLKNQKHEKFCQNIVSGLNQTDAYMQANYKATGETARSNASRLLTNANVLKRVAELNAELKDGAIADGLEVRKLWTSTMRGQLTEQKVSGGKWHTVPVAMSDRLAASNSLAKALGMFSNVDSDTGQLDQILGQLERARHDYGGN